MIANPGRPEPGLVRLVRRYLAPVIRLCHRPRLEGTEHLPPEGPFLLIANHSAGLGVSEILAFLVTYLEQVGPERRLAGFAHPTAFRIFPTSVVLPALGAVPSTYEAAHAALASGVPLLVFPGGDHETFRPIWQANRVDFGGRIGFLRIARSAGVPVVPLGIRGGHFTGPVLFRSRLLATALVVPRLLGVKRWGLSLLGVIVAALLVRYGPAYWPVRAALVWIWLGSPLAFLPWVPWTLRLRIGAPLSPETLFPPSDEDLPEEASGDESLRRALTQVQAAVQGLVYP